jgi:hypothetical protein
MSSHWSPFFQVFVLKHYIHFYSLPCMLNAMPISSPLHFSTFSYNWFYLLIWFSPLLLNVPGHWLTSSLKVHPCPKFNAEVVSCKQGCDWLYYTKKKRFTHWRTLRKLSERSVKKLLKTFKQSEQLPWNVTVSIWNHSHPNHSVSLYTNSPLHSKFITPLKIIYSWLYVS